MLGNRGQAHLDWPRTAAALAESATFQLTAAIITINCEIDLNMASFAGSGGGGDGGGGVAGAWLWRAAPLAVAGRSVGGGRRRAGARQQVGWVGRVLVVPTLGLVLVSTRTSLGGMWCGVGPVLVQVALFGRALARSACC